MTYDQAANNSKIEKNALLPLPQKCLYYELFWFSPYSIRMRENTDQNNSDSLLKSKGRKHYLLSKIWKQICFM